MNKITNFRVEILSSVLVIGNLAKRHFVGK